MQGGDSALGLGLHLGERAGGQFLIADKLAAIAGNNFNVVGEADARRIVLCEADVLIDEAHLLLGVRIVDRLKVLDGPRLHAREHLAELANLCGLTEAAKLLPAHRCRDEFGERLDGLVGLGAHGCLSGTTWRCMFSARAVASSVGRHSPQMKDSSLPGHVNR